MSVIIRHDIEKAMNVFLSEPSFGSRIGKWVFNYCTDKVTEG